jgi:hypothetical protein
MSLTKRKILISEELLESPVGSFFQVAGLECVTEYSVEDKEDLEFIINDYCPEFRNVTRIKTDPAKKFSPEIEQDVKGELDKNFLENFQVQKLLKIILVKETGMSLVDSYSNSFKSISSIKLHEYLNTGYFIDLVVIEAYKNNFNYDLIRQYLNHLFEFSFQQIQNLKSESVLELTYSFSPDVFALELSFVKENFRPVIGQFKELRNRSNCLSLSFFPKRDRVSISSVWFKSENLKEFRCWLSSEINFKNKSADFPRPLMLGIDEDVELDYQPRIFRTEEVQGRKLADARKFAKFIREYRSTEVDPKDLMSLELSDVDNYLTFYPFQDSVVNADEEVKRYVLNLLQDEKFSNSLDNYFEKNLDSSIDPYIERIQEILSSKKLKNIEEIIRIKGLGSNSEVDQVTLKGWLGAENDPVAIDDKTESITNEDKWISMRSGLLIKIQEEIHRAKSVGIKLYSKDLIDLISRHISESAENVEAVMKDVIEEALSSGLTQKSALQDAFALSFIQQQSHVFNDSDKMKLEDQISRMRFLMDQMKEEMLSLRSGSVELAKKYRQDSVLQNQAPKLFSLKNSLLKAINSMRLKEAASSNQKEVFEKILLSKEVTNKRLESKIEQLKAEHLKSNVLFNAKKIEALKEENKILNARLALTLQKLVTVNEKKTKEKGESAQQNSSDKLDETTSSSNHPEQDRLLMNVEAEKKILEDKFRNQALELKKADQKLKLALAHIEDIKKRNAQSSSPHKVNDLQVKQVENAKMQASEAIGELAEKKKELHKLKQENAILTSKLTSLAKKLSNLEKKAA